MAKAEFQGSPDAVFDAISDTIVVVDRSGRIVFTNDRAEALLG